MILDPFMNWISKLMSVNMFVVLKICKNNVHLFNVQNTDIDYICSSLKIKHYKTVNMCPSIKEQSTIVLQVQ